MKRNETLTYLARIMEKCNELDLPCERVITHYSQCIEELADDAIIILRRILSKPEIRTCRIPLIIDFDKMKDIDYWLDCKIFNVISSSRSATLKEKFELLTNLILELEMMRKQVDPLHAQNFFKRMAARVKKKKYFPYEIYRADPDNLTIKKLWRLECQLTYDLLIKGVLDFDKAPSGDEVEKVRIDLLMKGLESGIQPPKDFEKTAAKIRRYSYWKDQLFMINYPLIYKELYQHCFEKLSKEQRMAIYEYDEQLKMLHQDMAVLKPELAKYISDMSMGSLENTIFFAPFLGIKKILQQEWFVTLRSDKRYDKKWAGAFADGLMRSEYGQLITELWKDKKWQIMGYIIGCLKAAGVINRKISNDEIAREAAIMDKARSFGKYIGKESLEQPYAQWIKEHADDYC